MKYTFLNRYCRRVKKRLTCFVATTLPLVIIVVTILSSSLLTSCKKLIEVDAPITSSNAVTVYTSDATAIAVLTGIYTTMSGGSNWTFATGNSSISLLTGLYADELTLYSGVTNTTHQAYYKNALHAHTTPVSGSEYWYELYNSISACNAAIEGLNNATDLTPLIKQQLTGEAKFLRGFFYFYLVNFFGDVPLVTTTDYKVNASLGRTSTVQVYQQIVTDLKEAQTLLSSDYLNGSLQNYSGVPERVRPTKWAATALLARVYLYNGDYSNAEMQATMVINHSSLFNLTDLKTAFLKNSNESIWQLQPINMGRNTEDAFTLIIPVTGLSNTNPVHLSSHLLNKFEAGDQRKTNWVNQITVGTDTFYYPFKYKSATQDAPVTEYLMVLRLAEQYLIRAETRAQLGNLAAAILDLNAIRSRAGLTGSSAATKEILLADILHERRVELFSEWGHRWLDLKRTGKVNATMSEVTPQKGGTWSPNWQLFPIPLADILKDPNITQNPGY